MAQYDPTTTLIKEIYAHPLCPNEEIDDLIEKALQFHNNGHYDECITFYKQAKKMWKEYPEEFNSEVIIYFKLQIGDVYESNCQDEDALAKYLEAKEVANITQVDQASLSVIIHKLACVYYHLENFKLSLEYFIKVIHIRETLFKKNIIDLADCAVVYNNYGVCLSRHDPTIHSSESLQLFTQAYAIFKDSLGVNHPRSISAERNIIMEKAKNTLNYTMLLRPLTPGITKAPPKKLIRRKGKGRNKIPQRKTK